MLPRPACHQVNDIVRRHDFVSVCARSSVDQLPVVPVFVAIFRLGRALEPARVSACLTPVGAGVSKYGSVQAEVPRTRPVVSVGGELFLRRGGCGDRDSGLEFSQLAKIVRPEAAWVASSVPTTKWECW